MGALQNEKTPLTFSLKSSATVEDRRLVKIDSNAVNVSKTGANGVAAGVALETAATGSSTEVAVGGDVYVDAGAAVAISEHLESDSVGRVIPTTKQTPVPRNIVGVARTLATAAGQRVLMTQVAGTVQYGDGTTIQTLTEADSPYDVATENDPNGTLFSNEGAGDALLINLPPAPVKGTKWTAVCAAEQAIQLNPGDDDGIIVNGALQTDGLYVAIDNVGDVIELTAMESGNWMCTSLIGTATVEGA